MVFVNIHEIVYFNGAREYFVFVFAIRVSGFHHIRHSMLIMVSTRDDLDFFLGSSVNETMFVINPS